MRAHAQSQREQGPGRDGSGRKRMMNPHRVGGGAGQDGRPSHDTESPTLAFIPTPDPADQRAAGASTELARIASAHTKELEPVTHTGGAAEGSTDGSSRAGTVIAGELRLAVNAPDGSSATECPQDQRPQPVQTSVDATVRPRTVSGLLERDALCERLRGQLLEGRAVRLVGAPGSGRSAILDAVAAACSGLAPAGVIRLSGCFRTPADLLQDLFAAAYDAPGYRPGRALVPGIMHDLCAIVVIDDVEFGGEALEELIAAAPESSFLLSSTPAAAGPLGDGAQENRRRLEDSRLPGLSRQSSLALLARLAGRTLDETERAWAVDLWFESEGLPLRFVQAAALLRHREAAIEAMAAFAPEEDGSGTAPQLVSGSFEAYLRQHGGADGGAVGDAGEAALPDPVPLPSVAESAAPALRIARGLSTGARRTLLLAAGLGGVCPSAPHLPALIDVGHGEAAIEELVEAGLAAPVGAHHRLVDGVADLVAAEWPVETALQAAAQHFTWWTGHGSVTEQQIADEAEVLLAAMHADREAGRHGQVVLLARACAPAFALALRWGAWERALRFGLESARATAGVAEEAWFHHELGVLALCVGAYDRSRAELEASVALRGALSDSRGTAAGRAALRQLEAAAARQGSRLVAVSGRSGSGLTGLRRVLPFQRTALLRQVQQRRSFADHSVSRRQIVLGTAAVVLMGALGAAAAYGIGAFQQAGATTGTVDQNVGTTAPQSTGSTDPAGDPAASPSSSASASASASPSGSASASASGGATSGSTGSDGSGSTQGTGATGGASGQSSSPSNPVHSSHPAGHSASPTLSPSTPVVTPTSNSASPSNSATSSASSSASASTSASSASSSASDTTGASSTTVLADGAPSASETP